MAPKFFLNKMNRTPFLFVYEYVRNKNKRKVREGTWKKKLKSMAQDYLVYV